MFEKSHLAAAACLAGFGLVWYLESRKKESADGEHQLLTVSYEAEICLLLA
jgi:hypothetical protein